MAGSYETRKSWITNISGNIINNNTAITGFLTAINTGLAYRVDNFGNPIEVRLLVNSNDASVGVPPAPTPGWTWSVAPPYAGIVGIYKNGSPISTERVVYPQ